MENSVLLVEVEDRNEDLAHVRSQNHKENHHQNGIHLHKNSSTIYMGFFPKGPGARVESVPDEKDCANTYCTIQGPPIKSTE